jgi:hypothetical protein
MKQELDTNYVHLELRDGMLVGTYKKGLKINLSIAREIVQSRLAFTDNKTLPALIFNQGVISMDKEARQFLSSADGIKGLKAAAIILDSPFGSFLGNFFLAVNKTSMPVRIFTNAGSASKWLAQFIS